MSYLFSNSVKYDRNAVDSFNKIKISSSFTIMHREILFIINLSFYLFIGLFNNI